MSSLPPSASVLQALIHDRLPLTRAIGLGISAWDGAALSMRAPLAPNINDKGCAFAGSIATVMTLSGWALVTLLLKEQGREESVFAAHSEIRYRRPVWSDFETCAKLTAESDVERFLGTLDAHGKAGLTVSCCLRERNGDVDCATLTAKFVAKLTAAGGAPDRSR